MRPSSTRSRAKRPRICRRQSGISWPPRLRCRRAHRHTWTAQPWSWSTINYSTAFPAIWRATVFQAREPKTSLLQQIRKDVEKDIRKSYNQILATKQDITSNTKEILSSETLQDLYQKQFELGEGDIITMVEGRATASHGAPQQHQTQLEFYHRQLHIAAKNRRFAQGEIL